MLLFPLLFCPLLFHHSDGVKDEAYRTLFVTAVMAGYWASEAMPLPITALLPLVLLPALGVQQAKQVAPSYMKDASMLFIGGLYALVHPINIHPINIHPTNIHPTTELF